MRLIVGISGASGVVMGYHMLKVLKQIPNVEVHLVVTEGAIKNFECETDIALEDVIALADYNHSNKNMAASISSGSFKTDGMIIIPCSMKTVSGIASLSSSLLKSESRFIYSSTLYSEKNPPVFACDVAASA